MEGLRRTSHTLAPFALTTLRVVVGVVMAVHGWLKLEDYGAWVANVERLGVPEPEVLAAIAVAAELGGGVALILGFLTPLAALLVFGQMIAAIALVHPDRFLAQDGGMEYPLVLAATALFFVARGAGPISIDHLLFNRRKRVPPRREVRRPRRYEDGVPVT
jgi:putative oxidoreductase